MSKASSENLPVVVAVDGSKTSSATTRWAAAEAARWHTSLTIVTAFGFEDVVVGGWDYPRMEWLEERKAASEVLLRHSADAAREVAPELKISTDSAENDAEPTLLALSGRARLLVLGEPSGAVESLVVGSTALDLAAGARCPVVIVRGRDGGQAQGPVVVGVDGSPMSEAAIAHAFDEASIRGVSLVALHTWHDGDDGGILGEGREFSEWAPVLGTEELFLAERLAGWQEKYPDVPVERVVVRDKPRHLLLEWSRKAQLVVVGSRGRGGFTGLVFGSTSQAMLHHADCPVMIVRTEPA
jgi:cation-transporting ATPase F